MELEKGARERVRLRGSDRDKAARLKREMRRHEPQRAYPRTSPAEAEQLPLRHGAEKNEVVASRREGNETNEEGLFERGGKVQRG